MVTAEGTFRADVGIEAGRIVQLATGIPQGTQDVDCRGLLIFPGFIDVHTHFDTYLAPFDLTSPDNFESGTRQAAAGGVTTVVDYAFQTAGETLHDAVDRWQGKAHGHALIDYGFHTVVVDASSNVLDEIPDMVRDGFPSFKVFMNHGFGDLSDQDLYGILRATGKAGGLVTVHAENGGIVEARTAELAEVGRLQPREVPFAMPPEAEGEASSRILTLARLAGNAPVYLVHMSCRAALKPLREARKAGQNAYGETRPTYLVLDESYYARPAEEAVRYMASPPFRTHADVEALWRALAAGDLSTVASDHTAWNRADKERGILDFRRMPPGIPATETMPALIYHFGVNRGRIDASRFVDVLSTTPAKLFGLFPRKGTIAPGADADVVLFDPSRRITLSKAVTHGAVDYEPYEGFTLSGYPVMTFSRGELIVREGTILGSPGRGQLLRRAAFGRMNLDEEESAWPGRSHREI